MALLEQANTDADSGITLPTLMKSTYRRTLSLSESVYELVSVCETRGHRYATRGKTSASSSSSSSLRAASQRNYRADAQAMYDQGRLSHHCRGVTFRRYSGHFLAHSSRTYDPFFPSYVLFTFRISSYFPLLPYLCFFCHPLRFFYIFLIFCLYVHSVSTLVVASCFCIHDVSFFCVGRGRAARDVWSVQRCSR